MQNSRTLRRSYLITKLPPRRLPRLERMRARQIETERRERQALNAVMFDFYFGG
jgi:hypothetical protein